MPRDIAKWNRKIACGEAWAINIRRVLILLAINAVSCRAGRVDFVLIYKDLGPWTAIGTVWFQHTRLYACTLHFYALPRSSTLPRGKGGDAELGLRGPRGSAVHAI
jgi:hypothetical protein